MKITDIRPYIIWVGTRNQLIVKVETDAGIHGWGESGLSYRELAVKGAIEHYREFLIDRDPMHSGALWQECYRSQYFEGGRALTAAIAAIDIALHDIRGKALGVPVHQLLGGRQREHVPLFATVIGEIGEASLEKARALKAAGWTCLRFPASGQDNAATFDPRVSIGRTAEWMTRIREELGHEIVLGVEYHHRLSVAEAASFCQKMPPGTLDFLEEPIRDESPAAYAMLRQMTDIPFAIGEEFSSKWQFQPYIERDLQQFNRLDVCNVGGLTEAMKVAGWSEAHYVDLMPHNPLGPICTAASVHLSAAVPNFAWMEYWEPSVPQQGADETARLFPQQMTVEGQCYRVPDAPGLGIEVDEELVRSLQFRFAEPPHLRRSDGSFTNW